MNAVGIIPVRLESSRLPNKAILDICGLPMFVHTCKRAMLAKTIDEVYLATDSYKVAKIAEENNINVIMTRKDHKNSTERIAEACEKIDCEIIVNIQGDEPLLYPDHIDQILLPMLNDSTVQVSIGITPFTKKNSTSDIKAVMDLNNDILFFSRNDIPLNYKKNVKIKNFWKLVFIVPHRKKWIKKYLVWDQSPLELIEDNHFLRLIENGVKIKGVEVNGAKISVDTQEDLNEVRAIMETDKIKNKYLEMNKNGF